MGGYCGTISGQKGHKDAFSDPLIGPHKALISPASQLNPGHRMGSGIVAPPDVNPVDMAHCIIVNSQPSLAFPSPVLFDISVAAFRWFT